MNTKIIKLPAVMAKTGKSRSGIYADMKEKKFPLSLLIGTRAVGWLESEITDWIEQKAKSREGAK